MPDRPPAEHDVDRFLRDAGARLRATAPATVAPVAARRRRWVLPATIATAAAAAIAMIVAVTSGGTETLQQVPADSPPTVVDGTVPSTAPQPVDSSVDTIPPTTSPDETTPAPRPAGVAVTDAGWDGPGSACLVLDAGVTGCLPGGSVSPTATTHVWVLVDGTAWRISVTSPDGTTVEAVATTPPAQPCVGDLQFRERAMLAGVSCGSRAALWEVLPDAPTGPPTPEVSSSDGIVALARVPREPDDGASAGWRIYTADLDLGFDGRCTLIVPDARGWYESCDERQPVHPGTLLVVHDGEAYLVDPTDGGVVTLGDAPLRTNGCDTPVRDVVGESVEATDGAVRALSCRGNDASGVIGASWLQSGPPDGALVTWRRDTTGDWLVTDSGTGIEPDPAALPLPPIAVALAKLDVAAVGFTDVTETVRGWMDADPSLTIADAIAAGEADAIGIERFDTLAMTAIPSLTLVEVTYPDDSVGGARYAVWTTEPDDGGHPLLVAWRWDLCTRGATPDGLCV
jgi:hypothetical protein